MKISGALFVLLSCVILANGQNSVTFLEANCGVSISGSRNSKSRIIGGGIADMYGNPWMASIINSVECGGTLITARFVLSAAHCITGSPTTVYLGEFDKTRRTANVIQVPADAEIPHPHYAHREIKNDIALFRLARAVRYTDYIRPICLSTNYNYLARTTYLTATGWGKTEHGVASNVLKTTTLTQYNRGKCSSTFRSNVDMSQICAGASNTHTCKGDSGGPITAKYRIGGTNRVIQLGIVSYGDQHCRTVGVYTNVIHYMGWITSVVRRGQTPPAPTQRPNNNYPAQTQRPNINYPAPTQRPNNDNPANNNIYYYYPNGNSPTYYYPNGNSPTYYYPNGNSAILYYPNSQTYYYPSGSSPTYYYPSGNSQTYYYPSNYVMYG